MRLSSGAWQEPKGSVAYGNDDLIFVADCVFSVRAVSHLVLFWPTRGSMSHLDSFSSLNIMMHNSPECSRKKKW